MAEVYTIEQLREIARIKGFLTSTYIKDFAISPQAYLNQTIVISGNLRGRLLGFWDNPIIGATVKLYIDGKEITTTTTLQDGYFEFDIPAKNLGIGDHNVRVVYEGSWEDAPTDAKGVTTVLEGEGTPGKVPQQKQFDWASMLPIILGITAGAIGLSLLAYGIFSKPEEAKAPSAPATPPVIVVKG
jgi:hypothetical protein